MYSQEKPPLPSWSIIEKRPELFCLDFSRTKKTCDAYNHEQDKQNEQSWKSFKEKLAAWKSSL